MIWGLQRRLLVLLFLPLGLVGLVSVFFHYQSAGTAALQQDQELLRLVPMLADSVVVMRPQDTPRAVDLEADPGLALLLAPPVNEFLKDRAGYAGHGVMDINGRLLLGDRWLPTVLPSTQDAEFLSVVEGGITYRVVAQRSQTAAGELIVMLADGSDARQHWLDTVLTRVVLPNLLLMLVAAVAVTWAVSRALRPLIDLKEAVERRSPRDLKPSKPRAHRPRCDRWCRRSTACSRWSMIRPRRSGALWPTRRTSCAPRWRVCRHRSRHGRRRRGRWAQPIS
jgi:two-component system, OmpR family, sensor histidine kinase TctE